MPLSPSTGSAWTRLPWTKAGLKRADDGEWLAYDSLGATGFDPADMRRDELSSRRQPFRPPPGLAERWQKWTGGSRTPTPAGFTAFMVSDTAPLHHLVREIWRLARAPTDCTLRVFEAQTRNLPRATEAERLVIQRVGQDVFRDALMTYWVGRCAVTGRADPRLLRASHIKPWARCETDAERLDVYNGLLLAAHLDAAFDAGLISFSDEGAILFSTQFAQDDRAALGIHDQLALKRVGSGHLPDLAWHRTFLLGIST